MELYWLHVLIPILVRKKSLHLLHMPRGMTSYFARCPQVVTILDASPFEHIDGYPPLWRAYFKISIRISSKIARMILTISNDSALKISHYLGVNPDKIKVIYLGVNDGTSNTHFNSIDCLQTKPYILYVGEIEPHKNIPTLIEAFSLIHRQNREIIYRLLIVGRKGRDTSRVNEAIRLHGLQENVLLLGYVEDYELDALYKGASLLVFPSLVEGFGLPPLEAMSRGIPVAVSDIPVFHEIFGNAVKYFDPTDRRSIANELGKLLSDEDLVHKLKLLGLERSKEYQWGRCAAETIQSYQDIIELPKEIPKSRCVVDGFILKRINENRN